MSDLASQPTSLAHPTGIGEPSSPPPVGVVGSLVSDHGEGDAVGPIGHAPRPQGDPRPVRPGGEGQWEVVLAASVIATLPMLVIFFLGQRYFVEGIATTGRKG